VLRYQPFAVPGSGAYVVCFPDNPSVSAAPIHLPRRRKLCIIRSDFLPEIGAHSRRCSSFPQKVTLAAAMPL